MTASPSDRSTDLAPLQQAFERLYRAADEAFDERWNFPTDMHAGGAYLDAMDRLGNLLTDLADHMPEPAWLSDAADSGPLGKERQP